MIELQYLPPWTQSYKIEAAPSQVRTKQRYGYKNQSKRSHRQLNVVDVERRLLGIQMPYFEWFFKDVIQDGKLKFVDSYADENGLVTDKEIQIIDGYTVSTDLRTYVVKCRIKLYA